jgi:putative thiamine transport system permease protein
VLAPSGWIARLLAVPLGWNRPPDLASVNDPLGLALMLGLMVKEVPFLLLVMLSALTQVPVAQLLATGRSLGYGRAAVWLGVIMPQVWPLIRLPVMVVLAYALSVVDMALILGPSNPPTLAVLLTRLFGDPDLAMLLPASAGGVVQLALAAGGFGLLVLAERAVAVLGRAWLRRGGRAARAGAGAVLHLLAAAGAGLLALGAVAMLALLVWSLAWRWPWPGILPQDWSLRAWTAPSAGWAPAAVAYRANRAGGDGPVAGTRHRLAGNR